MKIGQNVYNKCISATSNNYKYDEKCSLYNQNFICISCDNPYVPVETLILNNQYSRCISSITANYDIKCKKYEFTN